MANPYFDLLKKVENGYVQHVPSNNGQAPGILSTADLHAIDLHTQYMYIAFANWRKENHWASHIPWSELPEKFRATVSLAADLLAGSST